MNKLFSAILFGTLALSTYAKADLISGSYACVDANQKAAVVTFTGDQSIEFFIQNMPTSKNLVGTAQRTSEANPNALLRDYGSLKDASGNSISSLSVIRITFGQDRSVSSIETVDDHGVIQASYSQCQPD